MGRPLRARYANTTYVNGVQEMSNTDISSLIVPLISQEYVDRFGSAASFPYGQVLVLTGSTSPSWSSPYVIAGSVINTQIDNNLVVGDHPATNTTTRWYLIQNINATSTSVTNLTDTSRPVQTSSSDGVRRIQTMTNVEIQNDVISNVVSTIINGGQGAYWLGTTAPSDGGTWVVRSTITDSYSNTSGVVTTTYNLYQKTSSGSVGTVRPLKRLANNQLQEMTNAEIIALTPYIRDYIATTGIGTYYISTSTPPGGGTWVARGSFVDTRNVLSNDSYSGSYLGTFSAGFTGVYTGAFTGTYQGTYTGAFSGFYQGSYSKLGTFSGSTFSSSVFTGSFSGVQTTAWTSTFSNEFTAAYGGSYTRNFSGTYSGIYAGFYAGNYSDVYSKLWTGIYSGVYVGSFSKTFSGDYTATFAGSYANPYNAVNYTGIYQGSTFAGSYQAAFSGSYTGTRPNTFQNPYNAVNYTGTYAGSYAGSYGTAVFTGSFTGAYTGSFLGSYTRVWTGTYQTNFTGAYQGSYASSYTGSYLNFFSGTFTGAYQGFYSRSFSGFYAGTYSQGFTGSYGNSFSRLFTGAYSGLTVSASTTTTTYTLWVRTA